MKFFFTAILFTVLASNLWSQKIKYHDIKHDYKALDYLGKIDDKKYYPLLAGFCSYLIPGGGQFYAGEPLRGLGFLAGTFVSSASAVSGILLSFTDDGSSLAYTFIYAGVGGIILFSAWSIVDAILVAHMKNIAYYELGKEKALLKVEPLINLKQGYQQPNSLVCGISLKMSF